MTLSLPALAATLLIALTSTAVAAPDAAADGPLRVDRDTSWTSEVDAPAGLVIAAGTHARLEGATLRLGGRLQVEQGATLELLPSQGRPARILGDAQSAWIAVNGTLLAHGTPRSEITGLWGYDLYSVDDNIGGIQVWGRASLDAVDIHDGSAPVVVNRGGLLEMSNATVERLGRAGIAGRGTLVLQDSVVRDNDWFAIAGRDGCAMTLRRVVVESTLNAIVANPCNGTLSDLTIHGGGLLVNGNSHISVENAVIDHYTQEGITLNGAPASGGHPNIPHVRLRSVILDSGGAAREGIHVELGNLTFDDIEVRNHRDSGVFSRQSDIHARSGSIGGNGRNGIEAIAGRLLLGDIDFSDPSPNAAGPVSHMLILKAGVQKEGHLLPAPTVTVWDDSTGQVVAFYNQSKTNALASWQGFGASLDGEPIRHGPFRYRLEHPEMAKPVEGVMEQGAGEKTVLGVAGEEHTGPTSFPWSHASIAALAVLLLVVLVGGTKRLLQRRRR